ncbi:D-mannonate dehydratase [Escherichia coli]
MKIVKAEVFVTCPGRNFVTLKITTEDGITGLGDATLNGRELSVASYLQDHLCPQLIGRDAHRIEDIWQFFYKGAYWRRGPVTMSAISAVDMALWDIKAKAANMPLYQLLGGASREGVMVYCHTTGHSIDEALDDYARHQELGFKAIRVQCGIPGMKTTYGMSKGKGLAYEPATKGQWPEEQLWSTEKYLDFMPKLFDAVRNKFGFNEHLLHDMHHRLTPIEAARFGKSIEPGTYVRPHRHPHTFELLLPLRGRFVVLNFDDRGTVTHRAILGETCTVLEMAAGTWHAVLSLDTGGIIFEVKHGGYQPVAADDYAHWAPAEGEPGTTELMAWYAQAQVGDSTFAV